MAMEQRFSQRDIEQLLREYRQSGLTQEQFAAQAGLPVSRLRHWLYRQPRLNRDGFVEVEARPSVAAAAHYRLEFPGGISLSFSGPIRAEELEALCQLLGR